MMAWAPPPFAPELAGYQGMVPQFDPSLYEVDAVSGEAFVPPPPQAPPVAMPPGFVPPGAPPPDIEEPVAEEPPAPAAPPAPMQRPPTEQLRDPYDPYARTADIAEQHAAVGARATGEVLKAKQVAFDEIRRQRAAREQERQGVLRRKSAAEDTVAAEREELRGMLKSGEPPLSDTQWAAMIASSVADALAQGLSRGKLRQDPNRIANVMAQHARNWQAKVAGQREVVAGAQDAATALDDAYDRSEREHQLMIAELNEELARRLDLQAAQAQDEVSQINFANARDIARAQAQEAERKAQLDEMERLGKFEDKAWQKEIDARKLEQEDEKTRIAEWRSRQDAAQGWAAVKDRRAGLALDREKFEEDKRKAKAQAEATGTVINPVTLQPIGKDRFGAADPKKTEESQGKVQSYVETRRLLEQYLGKLQKVGRTYQGYGSSNQILKSQDQADLDQLHGKLVSELILFYSGASASDAEVDRLKKVLPGPRSWTQKSDPAVAVERFASIVDTQIEDYLQGRGIKVRDGGKALPNSPSYQFKAVQKGPAETPSDRIQLDILSRDSNIRGGRLSNYLTGLRDGRYTKEEAQEVVNALADVAESDILTPEDTEVYRSFANKALDFYEQGKFAKKPGALEKTIAIGEAVRRGDTAGIRKAQGEKTEAEREREDIGARRKRVLGK